ncbi:MAG: tetratricopeptide repeat protein [Candidatus Hodarchaeales archaeon]|jgi:tetratricopeptide (TPR) repeat protein
MKLTNLNLNDFFNTDGKFTLLVGAGCSIDNPSCLPAGYAMMESLINHACHESDINGIIELMKSGQLRFETLVEIIRDQLDPNLDLIDYYGMCDKPNIQHFFIAEMIKKGNFVMTTNFDHLIEYALNHSGVPNESIIPVITREDFEVYANPYDQLTIITQQPTKDSLIATIQAFGSNKEGENVFQLEAFKQPLFENITKERSLVIIGYSGSDDFDIVPTLKVLKQLKNVIWINYSHDLEMGKEQIFEVNEDTVNSVQKLDLNLRKVTQILLEIWQAKNTAHVYLVNVNTTKMAEGLINIKPNISSVDFSLQPKDYLSQIYPEVNDATKYYIPYKIYIDKAMYDNALPCLKKLNKFAEETEDTKWRAITLNNIGELYNSQGKYTDALKNLEKSLELVRNVEGLVSFKMKSSIFNNMASVYSNKRDYPGAINYYKDAARIQKQRGDLNGRLINLNNLAEIYRIQERFPESLKYYEEALKLSQQLGKINFRGTILNNIGMVYASQRNYSEAMKRYEESLKIAEQLGNKSLKLIRLRNIGSLLQNQGNSQEALRMYNEAILIADQIGDLESKNTILESIRSSSTMGIETQVSHEIRKIKEDIDCHPKWNNNDIKSFIKNFSEGFFNAFRDSLNWQRIKTIFEDVEPTIFRISSGSPIQATIQIVERNKKKKVLQIVWEEHSDLVRSLWKGVINQFKTVFSKPGLKSLRKSR